MGIRIPTTIAVAVLAITATLAWTAPASADTPHGDSPGRDSAPGQQDGPARDHAPGQTRGETARVEAPGQSRRTQPPAAPASPTPDAETPAVPPATSNGNPTPGVRYPLCHATGSDSNPYVAIEVALPAILRAHDHHHEQHARDDIIPAIPGYYEGLDAEAYTEGCTTAPAAFRAMLSGAAGGELPTAALDPAQEAVPDARVTGLAATGDDSGGLVALAGVALISAGGLTLTAARRRGRIAVR